ncbi:uncharacterized protein LOC128673708 isoform X2 [Plodia interpunctella]|uniref:uncharacterized protein LOC128673708 isoform X2 n=1 Tax=Plodia interpunctella TaxID=58824 RepID=UPI0023680C02|nr:uncharacterized protein LOC128673708 [Plodia interpunctella]
MDRRVWCLLLFAIIPACRAWHPVIDRREEREMRRPHFHTKRHMLPTDNDIKKRSTTQKPREIRKKPSGHLAPLDEDDIENDEFVSVAIGPPPVRPKANKPHWKPNTRPGNTAPNTTSTNLVKDLLIQLGRELLSHQVSDDFVFGQYVGNSMKNLTSDLRLKMQHELLDVIVKYQKINAGEYKQEDKLINTIIGSKEKLRVANDTEESWPDFTNLAKIVG